MQGFGQSIFGNMPPVVKNLLIINVLMFVATEVFDSVFHTNLRFTLGLHYITSTAFKPYQIVTYMFMHGDLTHLFFNMFALWMFGKVLETVWGPQKFFIYYFVTGLGAVFLHLLINHFQIQQLLTEAPQEMISLIMNEGADILKNNQNYTNPTLGELNTLINGTTIGASGAVFGVLLAFGMLFPNTELMLLFPPIPIKAKWMVIGYGALELFLGISGAASNIAHFAHLGGMVFGFILIKYWKNKGKTF